MMVIICLFIYFCLKVKKIASDFYDDLPYHTSWTKVIWDFIVCPDVGPNARVKRHDTMKEIGDSGDKTE